MQNIFKIFCECGARAKHNYNVHCINYRNFTVKVCKFYGELP